MSDDGPRRAFEKGEGETGGKRSKPRDDESSSRSGTRYSPADADHSALDAHKCDCPDCASAVSPAAYLAYLLRYTTSHLKWEETDGDDPAGPGYRVYQIEGRDTGDVNADPLRCAVAVTAGGNAQTVERAVADWLSVAPEDGLADRRGEDSVTIRVGAQHESGDPVFDPPAVQVDPGTTVRFEWQSGPYAVVVDGVVPDGTPPSQIAVRPKGAGESASQSFPLDLGAGGEANRVSLDDLSESVLCQPVGEFPVGCEATEETVRHVRLGTESLLRYTELAGLTNYDPADGEDYPDFFDEDERMARFRTTAYRELLAQWGTSREDLREAQYDAETREWVAGAVGIPESRVPDLALDPSADLLATDAVSETNLEDLFGLPKATTLEDVKNPEGGPERTSAAMANVPLDPIEEPSIRIWRNEALADEWYAEDYPKDSFPFYLADGTTGSQSVGEETRPVVDPDLVSLDDVRPTEPAPGVLGALGDSSADSPEHTSVESADADSAASKIRDLVGDGGSGTVEGDGYWSDPDGPADADSVSQALVDEAPGALPDDDRVRRLWVNRRNWVDDQLATAWAGGYDSEDGVATVVTALNAMVDPVEYETDAQGSEHGPAWYPSASVTDVAAATDGSSGGSGDDSGGSESPDELDLGLGDLALSDAGFLEDVLLLEAQLTGDDATAAAARRRRHDVGHAAGDFDPDADPEDEAEAAVAEQFNLSRDAFVRLVELLSGLLEADPETDPDAGDWWEACSILVGARKRSLFDVWVDEEREHGVHLDRRLFWQSLREPKAGEWSARLDRHGDTTAGDGSGDSSPVASGHGGIGGQSPFDERVDDLRDDVADATESLSAGTPLIDPEQLTPSDLREDPTPLADYDAETTLPPDRLAALPDGRATRVLYERRTTALADERDRLADVYEQRLATLQATFDRHVDLFDAERAAIESDVESWRQSNQGDLPDRLTERSPVDPILDDAYAERDWESHLGSIRQSLDESGTPPQALSSLSLTESEFADLWRLRERAKPTTDGDVRDADRERLFALLPLGSPLDPVLTDVYQSLHDGDLSEYYESASEADWDALVADVDEALATDASDGESADRPAPLAAMQLSVSAYEEVRRLRTESLPSVRGTAPPDPLVSSVVGTLTTAWKRVEKYDADRPDNWVDAESAAGLTRYWQVYRARLPKWRARRQDRAAWQERLVARSDAPIVDPDLLGGVDDFADPAYETAAFDLWRDRKNTLHSVDALAIGESVSEIVAASDDERVAALYDDLLSNVAGVTLPGLHAIETLARQGTNVSALLSRLDLTPTAFGYLVDVADRIGERPVTDEEWANVRHICTQVWKQRQFGRWHREEWGADVVLSPDQFDLPDEGESFAAPGDDHPVRWRVSLPRRWNWEDSLETRIEQRAAVDDRLDAAVAAAECEAFPILRELLVDRIPLGHLGDATPTEKAEWFTERLFLDVESYPGRETTRLSQATASLQRLIERVRSGGVSEFPGLPTEIDDASFADRWEWLGRYPSWKAAMGVYLYPQNVLMPSLRQWQTHAFHDVVSEHATTREFTQEDAADAFESYLDQLGDLDGLSLSGGVCGCLGEGVVAEESPQARGSDPTNYVGYVFARPGRTDDTALYCRTVDPAVDDRRHSELWPVADSQARVEGWRRFDVGDQLQDGVVDRLHGASYYDGLVYLFLDRRTETGRRELGYLTFDVADRSWSKFDTSGFPATGYRYRTDEEVLDSVDVVQVHQGTPPRLFVQTTFEGDDTSAPLPEDKVFSPTLWQRVRDKMEQASEDDDGEMEPSVYDVLETRERVFYAMRSRLWYLVEFGADGSPPDEPEHVHLDTGRVSTAGTKYYLENGDGRRLLDLLEPNDVLGVFQVGWDEYAVVFFDDRRGRLVSVTLEGVRDSPVQTRPEVASYGVEAISGTGNLKPHTVFADRRGTDNHPMIYYSRLWSDTAYGDVPGEDEPVEKTLFTGTTLRASTNHGETDHVGMPSGTRWLVQLNNSVGSFTGRDRVDAVHEVFLTDVPGAPDARGGRLKGMRLHRGSVEEFATLTPRFPDWEESQVRRVVGREAMLDLEPFEDATVQSAYADSVSDLLSYHVNRKVDVSDSSSYYTYDWGVEDHTVQYVREAFFHLPLHLARTLATSGNYDAALWWYRKLFDYVSEQRVWPGDLSGGEGPTDYTPAEDWLTDPLQPHALAQTREDAYMQFVVLSIVQCLEDYADEEFGRDTPRSVASATWHYETALDLLDHPLLVEHEDPCDLVVDELRDAYQSAVMDAALWTDYPEYSRAELAARGEELVAAVESIDDFTDRKAAVQTVVAHLHDGDLYEAFDAANEAESRDDEADRYRDRVAEDGTLVGWVGDRYSSLFGDNASRLVDVALAVNDRYSFSFSGTDGDSDDGTDSSDGTSGDQTGDDASDSDLVDDSTDGWQFDAAETATPFVDVGGEAGDGQSSASAGSWRNDQAVDTGWDWRAADSDVTLAADNLDVAGETAASASSENAASTETDPAARQWEDSLDLSSLGTAGEDETVDLSRSDVLASGLDTGGGFSVPPGGFDSGGFDPTDVPPMLPDYDDFDTSASVMDIFLSNYTFCIPDNPFLAALRRHARLNLRKIRSGRNIAGMRREMDAYAASMDAESVTPTPGQSVAGPGVETGAAPTDYRFETVLQRAKELARLAKQTESQLLGALEKRDQQAYRQQQARQQIELSREQVSLQETKVTRAEHKVELSRLQRERARIKKDTYAGWVATGKLDDQKRAQTFLALAEGFQWGAVGLQAVAAGTYFGTGKVGAGFGSLASAASTSASALSTHSQLLQMRAAFQRRMRRWRLQRELAARNEQIGSQRVTLARDQVEIARQQRDISELRTEHAEDVLAFHRQKFTDRELYDWMSQVLERVYRYYLGQATAVARLAQRQIAFQRQELPQQFVENDYWEAPKQGDVTTNDEEETDRKGLTGSARLLRDITSLEQFEFETDERKLQVEKTISLAQSEPLALQRFRETGEVTFSTTLREFDADHPGLYMRQIKDVRVSVVALTPPTEGINAKLRNDGVSRIVVGDDQFRETTIERDPETVVLDRADDGERGEDRFTLKPREQELLRPFENSGVATDWELEMPKAANDFDYGTIADVQVTIEYSAFESQAYRQQVVDRLPAQRTVERTFSFHDDFSDAWYELHEADGSSVTVTFDTERADFPAQLDRLEIDGAQLYVAGPTTESDREDLQELGVEITHVDGSPVTGKPVEGIVDTRAAFSGDDPAQEWSLTLTVPEYGPMSDPFADDVVEDLLFVLTVAGQAEEWPR